MAKSTVPIRKPSGQLRHVVTLQQSIPTTDALGGRSETWESYGPSRRAAVEEFLLPKVTETDATVIYEVTMRYRADVYEKFLAGVQQRVVELNTGRVLKVLAVINPEERNRDLVLTCGKALVGN